MTHDEYLQTINCLVAERVYGWTGCHLGKDYSTGFPSPGHRALILRYSQHIAAAWPLAEKYRLSLIGCDAHWRIGIYREGHCIGEVVSASAPLAICLAVLGHLSVPVPAQPEGARREQV